MLCLPASSLPQGDEWEYELKLEGYWALAIKTAGEVLLRSRNNKDFSTRYRAIVDALRSLPDETIIDGEIVAFDESDRPSFNALQNYASSKVAIYFYAFDLPMLAGRDLTSMPLHHRREVLQAQALSNLADPIRFSPALDSTLDQLIRSVREQKFEGLIAKRRDSRYVPGQRSGAWLKMRVNHYTPTPKNFDALIFGYYEGGKLQYVSRTRNGFTPAIRDQLFRRFTSLQTDTCPFANLPESSAGRWGQGLTAAKMNECCWLKPVLVGQFEFAEWTPDNHLRHSRFIAVQEAKDPKEVRREQ